MKAVCPEEILADGHFVADDAIRGDADKLVSVC